MNDRKGKRERVVALLATDGATDTRGVNIAFGMDALADRWTIRTYEPRAYDVRIAVRVDDDIELQRLIRATSVILEWDTLGMGFIVYPKERLS